MEVTSPFAAFHGDCRVSRAVNDAHSVPVGLSTVSHKSLELRLRYSMPSHDVVEVLPEDELSFSVLRLEITTCNS